MATEPALPIETHPRPRRVRCAVCGQRAIVRDGVLVAHQRLDGPGWWCSAGEKAPPRSMHERDVEP